VLADAEAPQGAFFFLTGWAGAFSVRVRKTRQIKNLEPRFDFIGTEKALERREFSQQG
jgi:hypothetical protein